MIKLSVSAGEPLLSQFSDNNFFCHFSMKKEQIQDKISKYVSEWVYQIMFQLETAASFNSSEKEMSVSSKDRDKTWREEIKAWKVLATKEP